jgi:hypothetical protein
MSLFQLAHDLNSVDDPAMDGEVPPVDGIKYLVNWDNGNGTSGTFNVEFDTYAEADQYGHDWCDECNTRDNIDLDLEEGYTYAVVEHCPKFDHSSVRSEDDFPFDHPTDQLDYPWNHNDGEL